LLLHFLLQFDCLLQIQATHSSNGLVITYFIDSSPSSTSDEAKTQRISWIMPDFVILRLQSWLHRDFSLLPRKAAPFRYFWPENACYRREIGNAGMKLIKEVTRL
jgi:hypothetical protein